MRAAAGVARDAVKGAFASMLPRRGAVQTRGLRGRCRDDFELGAARGGGVAPTVLAGKVAQAMLLAWRAYDCQEDFRKATGLTTARMVEYAPDDTQVRPRAGRLARVHLACSVGSGVGICV